MHTFNFSVWLKIVQFVSTVSRFLHIMISHNIEFCKNEPRYTPLTIFHLNCILLLVMKMNRKQFLFYSWKIRAEGRISLNQWMAQEVIFYTISTNINTISEGHVIKSEWKFMKVGFITIFWGYIFLMLFLKNPYILKLNNIPHLPNHFQLAISNYSSKPSPSILYCTQ